MNYAKMILKYGQRTLIVQQKLTMILNVGVVYISKWQRVCYEPIMKFKRELVRLSRQAKQVEE